MEPVRFADGFDGPDTVAFGLSAGALGAVAGGLALAYLAMHTGLPGPAPGVAAAACLLGAAVAGWGRWAGRPLLGWAVTGLRFLWGPRTLTVRVAARAAGPAEAGSEAAAPGVDPAARGGVALPHAAAVPDAAVAAATPFPEPAAVAAAAPAAGGDLPAWARWLEEPAPTPAVIAAPSPAGGASPVAQLAAGVDASLQTRTPSDDVRMPEPPQSLPPVACPPAGEGQPAVPSPPPMPAAWEHLNDELVRWVHHRVRHPGARPGPEGGGAARPTPLVVLRDPAAELEPPPGRDGDEIDLPGEAPDGVPRVGTAPRLPVLREAPRGGRGRARRVTFFGLSGGIGRTTLAIETGCLLAARACSPHCTGEPAPLRVAYVDLDPRGSAASLRLGSRETPARPGPARGPGAGCGLPPGATQHPSGLISLWAPPSRSVEAGDEDTAAAAAVLHRLEGEGIELILVDCNGGATALSTWVLETCDDIYIVLTDSARGVRDAYRSSAALRRLGHADKLAYVVNRSGGRVDFGPTMADLGGSLVTTIPLDPAVAAAEDTHRIASLEADGPGVRAIHRLAAAIHPQLAQVGGADWLAGARRPDRGPALGVR